MSYFEDWMRQKGLSESSIAKYEGAITGAMTQWANENAIISGSLADNGHGSLMLFQHD